MTTSGNGSKDKLFAIVITALLSVNTLGISILIQRDIVDHKQYEADIVSLREFRSSLTSKNAEQDRRLNLLENGSVVATEKRYTSDDAEKDWNDHLRFYHKQQQ